MLHAIHVVLDPVSRQGRIQLRFCLEQSMLQTHQVWIGRLVQKRSANLELPLSVVVQDNQNQVGVCLVLKEMTVNLAALVAGTKKQDLSLKILCSLLHVYCKTGDEC